MHMRALGWMGCGLMFWGTGCAGTRAATPAPSSAPTAGPSAALPPDLSPLPIPAALVVSGSVTGSGASLAFGLPGPTQPGGAQDALSERLADRIAGGALGAAVAPALDLGQRIDFALALADPGDVEGAVSVALRDPDRAKSELAKRAKLVPGKDGVLVLARNGDAAPRGRPPGPDHDGDPSGRAGAGGHDDGSAEDDAGDSGRACELAPAYGASSLRLVCASSAAALQELGPWLARSAPRNESASDVHLDLHLSPVRPLLMARRRLVGALLGAAVAGSDGLGGLREIASGLGSDVVDLALDLDAAAVDVTLSGSSVDAAATLELSGSSSELGKIATAHPERSGPAPAAFWQLPGDADFAFFDRGIDDAELAKGRDMVTKLVGQALARSGVEGRERDGIALAIGKLASPAPLVYATGIDEARLKDALAAEQALGAHADAGARDEARRALAQALTGWCIARIDEPSSHFADALKDLSTAWSAPAVAAAFRARKKDVAMPSIHLAPLPAGGAALGAGAQQFVLEPSPSPRTSTPRGAPRPPVGAKAGLKAPAPLGPLALHLMVVPDGGSTWLVAAGDEALALAKAEQARGTRGATLSSREGLDLLKTAPVGAGGFVTERGFSEGGARLAALLGGSPSGAGASSLGAVSAASQGLAPIPFLMTARAGTTHPSVVATVRLPRAIIADTLAAVLQQGDL